MTRQHRNFYIDSKLEFALFFDPAIKDKEVIVKGFLESKDWKEYSIRHNKKVKFYKVSDDTLKVDIFTN